MYGNRYKDKNIQIKVIADCIEQTAGQRNSDAFRRQYVFFCLYGQENNMLKDELQSRSRSAVRYEENLKLSFLITVLHVVRNVVLSSALKRFHMIHLIKQSELSIMQSTKSRHLLKILIESRV